MKKLILLPIMLLLFGCTAENGSNAIYYWKTKFELNEYELNFLEKHDISRLYVKMFDVVLDEDWAGRKMDAYPDATIEFCSQVPRGITIVPTVFITLEALKCCEGREEELAEKIVERVHAMVSYNRLGPIDEVQLDCDWTGSTKSSFKKLCDRVKSILSKSKITLSGTVRLHQLYNKDFPFEKGVLMVYNTGNIKSFETQNSILSLDDVSLYVEERPENIELSIAYPTFGWTVWFRENKFMGLLHSTDVSDFSPIGDNLYEVIRDQYPLRMGDVIRLEQSDIKEIKKVKRYIEKRFGPSDNIIYHLDSANLSKYSDNEIKKIYSR